MQLDTEIRNAQLDQIEASIGPNPTLKLRTGSKPVNCGAPDSGSVLVSFSLPADWMAPARSGSKAIAGTWQEKTAVAGGIAEHYRVYDAQGKCRMQGTVGIAGVPVKDSKGNLVPPDMTLDNATLATGQRVQINGFTITAGNA